MVELSESLLQQCSPLEQVVPNRGPHCWPLPTTLPPDPELLPLPPPPPPSTGRFEEVPVPVGELVELQAATSAMPKDIPRKPVI
jgi:hypothetical protein